MPSFDSERIVVAEARRFGHPRPGRIMGTVEGMSRAATTGGTQPHGIGLLPRRLTPEELANAPVLVSLDELAIDDLSDDEHDRFLAALAG